jgi:hypothetical protein
MPANIFIAGMARILQMHIKRFSDIRQNEYRF